MFFGEYIDYPSYQEIRMKPGRANSWLNDEKLYSLEYSVSIIPEAGFRMLYRIFDAIDNWLLVANEKNLLLRVLRVQIANNTQ